MINIGNYRINVVHSEEAGFTDNFWTVYISIKGAHYQNRVYDIEELGGVIDDGIGKLTAWGKQHR